MAGAGSTRRSQGDRRPPGGHRGRPETGLGGPPRVSHLASDVWRGHIGPQMLKHALAALILISACHVAPVRAQDAAAPFDGDLQRLAEILGTLHYLRGICGANEGAKWRNEMQALIDAETPAGDRRARMIAGFNRGYNG